jgi:hypothetical protein
MFTPFREGARRVTICVTQLSLHPRGFLCASRMAKNRVSICWRVVIGTAR